MKDVVIKYTLLHISKCDFEKRQGVSLDDGYLMTSETYAPVGRCIKEILFFATSLEEAELRCIAMDIPWKYVNIEER